jgi:hypothetical protein
MSSLLRLVEGLELGRLGFDARIKIRKNLAILRLEGF